MCPFETNTKESHSVVVCLNWATDRNLQIKLVDTRKVTLPDLLHQESVNATFLFHDIISPLIFLCVSVPSIFYWVNVPSWFHCVDIHYSTYISLCWCSIYVIQCICVNHYFTLSMYHLYIMEWWILFHTSRSLFHLCFTADQKIDLLFHCLYSTGLHFTVSVFHLYFTAFLLQLYLTMSMSMNIWPWHVCE